MDPASTPYKFSDAMADVIAPTMPPRHPGRPCSHNTPHVSCNPIFSYINFLPYPKPSAETAPPMQPIKSAPQSPTTRSEQAPIATPPASVAFWMTSMLSLPETSMLIANAVMPHEHSAHTVLITTRCLERNASGARAPLKLGHYIHKKMVPIIENKSDSFVGRDSWASSTSFLGDVM